MARRATDFAGKSPRSGPAGRQCSFCEGAGERIVEIEIDGFTQEIVIDCFHPLVEDGQQTLFDSN